MNNDNIAKQMEANMAGTHPSVPVHRVGGLIITGSQHDRVDGTVPTAPPQDFEALRSMTADRLNELGMRVWDETGLMLFPGEWYESIPAGYDIIDISGNKEKFEPGVTDNDVRFGCLAFGIIPPAT